MDQTAFTVDVDSGERDPVLYSTANDYVVPLKTSLYDVTKIELVSARIPHQSVVHDYNNTFTIEIDALASDGITTVPDAGSYDITLTDREFSSGTVLRDHVLARIVATGITTIDSVEWRSTRQSLKFSNVASTGGLSYNYTFKFNTGVDGWSTTAKNRTTPNQVMGFTAADQQSIDGVIDQEGRVNVEHATKMYVLKISTGSDEFNQDCYTDTPFYTGTLLNTTVDPSEQFMFYSGQDDIILHEFIRGPQKAVDALRIQFFSRENNKLVPCDFRSQDHALKFKITGNLDRTLNLPKVVEEDVLELPPPINIPGLNGRVYDWKKYVPLIVILFIGFVLIKMLSA
jgi:hypothetical protein